MEREVISPNPRQVIMLIAGLGLLLIKMHEEDNDWVNTFTVAEVVNLLSRLEGRTVEQANQVSSEAQAFYSLSTIMKQVKKESTDGTS